MIHHKKIRADLPILLYISTRVQAELTGLFTGQFNTED